MEFPLEEMEELDELLANKDILANAADAADEDTTSYIKQLTRHKEPVAI